MKANHERFKTTVLITTGFCDYRIRLFIHSYSVFAEHQYDERWRRSFRPVSYPEDKGSNSAANIFVRFLIPTCNIGNLKGLRYRMT